MGNFGQIGISSWGNQNLKFFEILVFLPICISNISVVWKFEWKRSLTFDFRANSIFKGFDQKILIFGQYAIPKGHKYWMQLATNTKFCQDVPHMCILKAKKFHVWKIISMSRLGNLWPKIREIWGNSKFFSVGGPNLKIF